MDQWVLVENRKRKKEKKKKKVEEKKVNQEASLQQSSWQSGNILVINVSKRRMTKV